MCISVRLHHVQTTCNMAFLLTLHWTAWRKARAQCNTNLVVTLRSRCGIPMRGRILCILYTSPTGGEEMMGEAKKFQSSPNMDFNNQFRLLLSVAPFTFTLLLLLPKRRWFSPNLE